jgi:hypothetical protein
LKPFSTCFLIKKIKKNDNVCPGGCWKRQFPAPAVAHWPLCAVPAAWDRPRLALGRVRNGRKGGGPGALVSEVICITFCAILRSFQRDLERFWAILSDFVAFWCVKVRFFVRFLRDAVLILVGFGAFFWRILIDGISVSLGFRRMFIWLWNTKENMRGLGFFLQKKKKNDC